MSHRTSSLTGPWPRRLREPWGDSASIRAELYSDEQLQRHAVSLADVQIVVRDSTPVVSILQRVEQNPSLIHI